MTATDSGPRLRTFETFEPGEALGTIDIVLDDERRVSWSRIFGDPGGDGAVPRGILLAVAMEGYMRLIQPRPPGNVHAGQTLSFTDRRTSWHRALTISVTCVDKRMKRDRRWLGFELRVEDRGELLMTGILSTIWAA